MDQQIDTIRIKKIKEKQSFSTEKKQPFSGVFSSRQKSFLANPAKQKQSGLFCNKIISLIIGLLVFLTPIFFLSFTNEAYEFNKVYLIFYLSGIAFIFWLLKMILQKEVKIIRAPLDLLVIVFLVAMALSTLFSADKISSLLGFYGRFSDSLILFLSLGMMYFVIVNNLVKSQISKLLNLFLLSSFIAIIIGICSVCGKFIIPLEIAQTRTFNPTAGSLQGLAMFAAMIIVLSAGLFLQKKKNILFRYFIILLLGVSLLFLIIINFVPAWIALFAGSVFLLFLKIFQRTASPNLSFAREGIVAPLILIVFCLFLFSPGAFYPNPPQVRDKLSLTALDYLSSKSSDGKIINSPQEVILDKEISNEVVKNTFFAHSVFGSGLGTFSQDFSLYRPAEFNQNRFWALRFDKARSEISEQLATTGLVGVLTWLILLWVFFVLLIKNTRNRKNILNQEDFENQDEKNNLINQNNVSIALVTSAFTIFIGTIFYHQNAILWFSLWLFIALGMCLFVGSRKLKISRFSLEENSEKANVFKGLSLAAILVLVVSFFVMGKFYYADAFYKKGIVQQDLEQAIENYQKAADLNPYRFVYRVVLAKAHLQKATTEAKKDRSEQDDEVIKQEVSRAINEAKMAVELSPKNVITKETLAMIYRDIVGIAQGANEWALRSFEEALALEPLNPVLATETGKACAALENSEKAVEYFRKAIFFKKDYLDAYLHLALVYEKQEKNNLAIKELEKVAQPESLANLEIIYQLGRFNYNQDNTDEAIKYFRKVLDIFPNHSNSLYSLGVVYQKQGWDNQALKMFERVLQLNPGNEDVKAKIKELE
jgi:tetratricopeptide (TPR) repeat protein